MYWDLCVPHWDFGPQPVRLPTLTLESLNAQAAFEIVSPNPFNFFITYGCQSHAKKACNTEQGGLQN